jgi:hypothetical protein
VLFGKLLSIFSVSDGREKHVGCVDIRKKAAVENGNSIQFREKRTSNIFPCPPELFSLLSFLLLPFFAHFCVGARGGRKYLQLAIVHCQLASSCSTQKFAK